MPEALGLSLEERKSTATLQLGPEDPEIPVGSWLLDDEPGTGEGIVWRTRSADMTFNTDTRQLTLEHIISTLQDAVLFGEHTYEDIAGAGASACSARAAAQYILARQSLWVLGDFDFDDIAWPYKFNGDTLFSALQTVTNSCPDACWEYDLSRIPFRVHIRRISDETTCEMRAGRNIRTLKRVIDRSGMYTRFYPIGKDDLHISGDYISKNESVYGMVAKVETFSGAETESSLRSWAWERLKRHCEPKVTVTISGLDLSESTGESLDRLTIGRKCRVPLPEFGTTITERITRIRVTDKIRKKEEVTVTLGNELPDLASIVSDVEKEQASGSGGGGRGGMKQAGEDHAWFVDTDTHVGMVAEAIIGHGPDGVDWSRVAEVIVDGDGIHNRVTRAEGYLVVMEAKIDLTEETLRAEFMNAADSLRSELEMSAASLRAEFENLNNSTRSELLITSESLRAEFTNEINSTRSELLITSESLRTEFTNEINSTRSELQITSESLRTEFTNEINSTRSEFQITSQSMRLEFQNEINSTRSELQITSESLRSTISNTASGLQSQINQNAGQIALRVAKGDVGTQLAVELGNVSISGGNLVVDGYVKASELTATYINSLFSGSQVFSSNYAFIRNLECTNFTQGEYTMDLSDAVSNVKVELSSGNTYTLYKKHFYSSDWVSAGNFSRAVTSIDWSWSGGMAKAVLTPQNQTFYSKQIDAIQPHGQATWDTDKKGFTVTLDVDDTEGTTVFSDEMHFNTTSSYDQGHTDGYAVAKGDYTKSGGILKVTKSTSGTAFPISFSIDAAIAYDSSTHKYTAKALCDDDLMDTAESGTQAYDAGRTAGYNSATGSYTKSGGVLKITKDTGGTAFPISFSIDAAITYNSTTHKYTAKALCDDDQMDTAESGTQAYDAGVADGEGKFTLASVTLQGSAYGSITPIGTEYKYTYTQLYESGDSYSYYKGNGSSVTGRGTKQSINVCGNAVRFKRHTSSETPSGTWYTIVSSGYDLTYYLSKSEYWYPGNGSSVTGRGDQVTGTNRGSSKWAYVSNSSGAVVRYAAGTAITNLRNPGTTNTNTYYRKTS